VPSSPQPKIVEAGEALPRHQSGISNPWLSMPGATVFVNFSPSPTLPPTALSRTALQGGACSDLLA